MGSKIAHATGFSQCAFKRAGVQGCRKTVWSAKFGVQLLSGEKFLAVREHCPLEKLFAIRYSLFAVHHSPVTVVLIVASRYSPIASVSARQEPRPSMISPTKVGAQRNRQQLRVKTRSMLGFSMAWLVNFTHCGLRH